MRNLEANDKRLDELYQAYLKLTEDKHAAATMVLARVIADTDFAHDITFGINQSNMTRVK